MRASERLSYRHTRFLDDFPLLTSAFLAKGLATQDKSSVYRNIILFLIYVHSKKKKHLPLLQHRLTICQVFAEDFSCSEKSTYIHKKVRTFIERLPVFYSIGRLRLLPEVQQQ